MMKKKLLAAFLLIALGGLAATFYRGRRVPPPVEPVSYEFHPETDLPLVSVMFPPGEWWGTTEDWTVLIHVARGGVGHVAVAAKGLDVILDLEMHIPTRRLERFEFLVSDAERVSTWVIRSPDIPLLTDREWAVPEDPKDDGIDRFLVDAIYGSFGTAQPPFRLFRSEIHNPETQRAERKKGFARLRRLLTRTERRSG